MLSQKQTHFIIVHDKILQCLFPLVCCQFLTHNPFFVNQDEVEVKLADVTRNLSEVSDAKQSLEKDLEQTKTLLEKEKEDRVKVITFYLYIVFCMIAMILYILDIIVYYKAA